MIEINIGENEAQQRTDRFLRKYLKTYALGDIYKLFRTNKIKVNDKRVKENYMLQLGDKVSLYIADVPAVPSERAEKARGAAVTDLNIIYEDENIMIVNKPAGVLVHPDSPKDRDTLIDRVIAYLESKNAVDASLTFRPAICNRLDRNTGGLVIVAKNYSSLKQINRLIREKSITKLYKCIVKGKLPEHGEIRNYLLKDEESNRVEIREHYQEEAKEVHTVYRTLKTNGSYSLMEIDLITGRSHQIRAHFSSIGHPLAGDVKYGDKTTNLYFKNNFKLEHQFLFAYKIIFNKTWEHLKYLEGKSFEGALPKNLGRIIDALFDGKEV